MDISVVVPLLNEEESLPELAAWIKRVMDEHKFSYEVLMVDDGSRDKSWEVIERLNAENPCVRGIRFRRNYGKSAALHVAFGEVRGDVVITMDADLQDSPDEIPELYRLVAKEGFDLISGYKQKRYDPITKTLPTKLFNWATRKVSGIDNLHDFNCGLKAYKKEVVKSIEIYGEMHRYIPVIAKAAGYDKIGEKIVQHQARKYGTTKFGLNRFINGFLDLLSVAFITKYMKRPMHFFGFWGTVFSMVGGGVLGVLGVIKILGLVNLIADVALIDRVPLLFFGAVTFLLGILLLATGLLAELIGRTSSNRNEYGIKETVGEKSVEVTKERTTA